MHQRRKVSAGGNWNIHPESECLAVDFGPCPECNSQIRFMHWLSQVKSGMFTGPIVLGNLQIAECSEKCGYISKLHRHKKRIREAHQINSEHDEGIKMQPVLASLASNRVIMTDL